MSNSAFVNVAKCEQDSKILTYYSFAGTKILYGSNFKDILITLNYCTRQRYLSQENYRDVFYLTKSLYKIGGLQQKHLINWKARTASEVE